MWNSYQRICFALLYATFASEYGYAGLWNSFLSYYVCAVMAVTVIITLVGVSTPLGVIIVVKLGTEFSIVPHLSVRNMVFLDRLIQ